MLSLTKENKFICVGITLILRVTIADIINTRIAKANMAFSNVGKKRGTAIKVNVSIT